MGLSSERLGRIVQYLPALTTGAGIPSLSEIVFSPRNPYTNGITPTLYKLGYVRVDSGGSGYSAGASVNSGATEVGKVILGDATVYGASGVIAAVRITNSLGLTLTSAPTLTVSGGSGAVLTAVLADPEAARIAFKADKIDWSYIGCAVDSGGTTDASEAAFITAWQSAYKMQLTQNSKPDAAGVQIPPAGYGQPDVTAATGFGGEVIDASEPTYGNGVGYAALSVAANSTTKLLLCGTTYARTSSKRLMHDDPGFQNQVINVADFGSSALTGFVTWLAANTSGAQRTADGLDPDASIVPGYDYKQVLVDFYTAASLSGPTTSATHNSNRRTIQSGGSAGNATPGYNLWRKYHRSLTRTYYASLKSQLGSDSTLSVNGFVPWPISPSYSVGGFFFNSAIHDGIMDSADYISTEWSTAPNLAAPITWTQMVAEFAIHANSVRAIGKMLTGPQVSLDPVYHKDAKRKSFLRQAVGLTYAFGASCYPCWDSFLLVDGATTAWRAFMEPSDYNGIWDFIDANAALYDGFENCPTVCLKINADTFCRTTSGVWPRNQFVMDAIVSLLAAGTPFAFSPYGALDTTLTRNSALENACLYVLTTTGQNQVLISETPTLDNWGAAASAAQLAQANAFWVSRIAGKTGSIGDVYAIPRMNTASNKIAIHVCNLQSAADGTGITETGLTLQLSQMAKGNNTYTAACYRPGSATVSLAVVAAGDHDNMALPSIDDRGAIVLLTMTAQTITPHGLYFGHTH